MAPQQLPVYIEVPAELLLPDEDEAGEWDHLDVAAWPAEWDLWVHDWANHFGLPQLEEQMAEAWELAEMDVDEGIPEWLYE